MEVMDGINDKKTFRVGSRSSELALIQTQYVIDQLLQRYPQHTFEIVKMDTTGDKILEIALPKIGEKSLFTKELEIALDKKIVDFVVHSLKDLPTTLPENKTIAAILKRENPCDVIIFHKNYKGFTLNKLPDGSVIGTSSLRRTAQLLKNYPRLKVVNIRGNLNTRLRKLNDDVNGYSAIVLAHAGVERLGWTSKIDQVLSADDMLYAVGQGALAVECRGNDEAVLSLLEPLCDEQTTLSVLAERSFLKKLGGGCSAPVGVNSVVNECRITLTGSVFSLDGTTMLTHTMDSDLFSNKTPIPNDSNNSDDDNYLDEIRPPLKKGRFKIEHLFCGITAGSINYYDMEISAKLGVNLAEVLIQNGALEVMDLARQEVLSGINNIIE